MQNVSRSKADALRPIGVFDSGVGGLTVLKSLLAALPEERFLYLGDTAKVPYGNKSRETVTKLAFENLLFLLERQVKAVVVACNTVSASCLDLLVDAFRIPVFGVIEPAVEAAVQTTRNGCIGVIGTRGTIQSGAYQSALKARDPALKVLSRDCPLLVPLAEEGYADHQATQLILQDYLGDFISTGVDSLILGCTHYPVLLRSIQAVVGPGVTLVESGPMTARRVFESLKESHALTPAPGSTLSDSPHDNGSEIEIPPQVRYFVTDDQPRFSRVAAEFLQREIGRVEVVRVVS